MGPMTGIDERIAWDRYVAALTGDDDAGDPSKRADRMLDERRKRWRDPKGYDEWRTAWDRYFCAHVLAGCGVTMAGKRADEDLATRKEKFAS